MADARTICITIPSISGETWVFIEPALSELAFLRQFTSARAAAEYAQGLTTTTGRPIEDAGRGDPLPLLYGPFDAEQARINGLLWLMTTIVHDGALD
ncbi:hypothetical protein [Sphingomonas sp.]|uniref:hypothetical protein n=1 Tax=Sphingomonas sp. TaxID=28214 RepID=UPI003B00C500